MLTIFAALFGATVLIPLFAQTVMGYSAQKAGELLSLGGFALIFFMPLVGFLVARVDSRYLIAIGLGTSAFALFSMTRLYLGIDCGTLALWRTYQAISMAFIFVPINVIAYAGMRPEVSNQVSALINLMRNMGGSIGISAVTTLIARRAQVHQAYLARNTFEYNPVLQQTLSQMTDHFGARMGSTEALKQAYGRIYGAVLQQATVLAYIDTFFIMATICVLVVGLLFLVKKVKTGQTSMAH
jgi:DHA2 family multidrug resistance protein